MRKLFRRLLTGFLILVVLAIIVAVVGEFFIEVARGKGWYTDAADKWDRVVSAVLSFVTAPAFIAGLALLTGLVGGLWLDQFLLRWDKRRAPTLESDTTQPSWAENRTRFTIREAACLIAGAPLLSFEHSEKAQSVAKEMVYYAGSGLLWPAELTSAQHEMWKQTSKMPDGFHASLDTFITHHELERYRTPGFKSWLPILDDQHKSRR